VVESIAHDVQLVARHGTRIRKMASE
jgi:hypothetical protein